MTWKALVEVVTAVSEVWVSSIAQQAGREPVDDPIELMTCLSNEQLFRLIGVVKLLRNRNSKFFLKGV